MGTRHRSQGRGATVLRNSQSFATTTRALRMVTEWPCDALPLLHPALDGAPVAGLGSTSVAVRERTAAGYAGRGLRTIGLDYSQPTLAKARARLPADIVLVAGDATQLPFADDTFDGALCFGVLQAVSDSAPSSVRLARVLAPGALLWIDALNRDGIAARLIELRPHSAR